MSSLFTSSRASSCCFSQWKWTSFFVSSRSGAVRSASLAENLLRYVIMPRAVSSSLLFFGVFRFLIASNFSDAGSSPLSVIVWPKKFTEGDLNCSFSEFSPILFLRLASSIATNALSCSSAVAPETMMSSAMPVTFGIPSYAWSSFFWKTSCDTRTPNGSRLNLYRPKGVLNVHSMLDSSSSSTCQYPFFVSTTEKYFLPWSFGSISSIVRV